MKASRKMLLWAMQTDLRLGEAFLHIRAVKSFMEHEEQLKSSIVQIFLCHLSHLGCFDVG